MVKALIWFNGIAFLGFGLVCLVSPEFPTGLSGLVLASGDAPIEIRAQYGGIFLAIAGFSIYSAMRLDMSAAGLMLLLLVYAGLASGRLLGVLLDPGPAGNYTYSALGFEVVMTLLLGVASLKSNQPGAP